MSAGDFVPPRGDALPLELPVGPSAVVLINGDVVPNALLLRVMTPLPVATGPLALIVGLPVPMGVKLAKLVDEEEAETQKLPLSTEEGVPPRADAVAPLRGEKLVALLPDAVLHGVPGGETLASRLGDTAAEGVVEGMGLPEADRVRRGDTVNEQLPVEDLDAAGEALLVRWPETVTAAGLLLPSRLTDTEGQ